MSDSTFNQIHSKIDYSSKNIIENIEYMQNLMKEMKTIEDMIELGGGEKNIEKWRPYGDLKVPNISKIMQI